VKKEFGKAVKFSVKKDNTIALTVSILESPYFEDGEYRQVNHYYINDHYDGEVAEFLEKVNTIIKTAGDWWDKSDIMTDYFHTSFYYHIHVGKWDKKHKKV